MDIDPWTGGLSGRWRSKRRPPSITASRRLAASPQLSTEEGWPPRSVVARASKRRRIFFRGRPGPWPSISDVQSSDSSRTRLSSFATPRNGQRIVPSTTRTMRERDQPRFDFVDDLCSHSRCQPLGPTSRGAPAPSDERTMLVENSANREKALRRRKQTRRTKGPCWGIRRRARHTKPTAAYGGASTAIGRRLRAEANGPAKRTAAASFAAETIFGPIMGSKGKQTRGRVSARRFATRPPPTGSGCIGEKEGEGSTVSDTHGRPSRGGVALPKRRTTAGTTAPPPFGGRGEAEETPRDAEDWGGRRFERLAWPWRRAARWSS